MADKNIENTESTALVLEVKNEVISSSVVKWEKDMREYISTIPRTFKTDEDFDSAKKKVVEMKNLATAAKATLKKVTEGGSEVSEVVKTVNEIVELLDKERLILDKAVKANAIAVNNEIVDTPIAEIETLYNSKSPTSEAFAIRLPMSDFVERIRSSIKRRQTIETKRAAANAEFANIRAEMFGVGEQLKARLSLIPVDKMHLFNDVQQLIASDEDPAPIIESRIKADNERQAEIERQAQEKAEAKAKAEAEKARVEVENKAKQEAVVEQPIVQPVPQQVAREIPPTQSDNIVKPAEKVVEQSEGEPIEAFQLIIKGKRSEVVATAKAIKQQFESVTLTELKEKNHE